MASHGPKSLADPKDLALGAFLQCLEALTLGMPFEVWKTRMGRYRQESTIEAFSNIYKRGGISGYWQGLLPKLVESALKGSVLLFSKEAILSSLMNVGVSEKLSGFVAGAGGGIVQVAVMGPCTFLITGLVTAEGKNFDIMQKTREILRTKGITGMYPGGVPLAFRQATNWASRQGFTEIVRDQFKSRKKNGEKLSVPEEAMSGMLGGALSTWNQPFEVARVEMQAAAAAGGGQGTNMISVMRMIIQKNGVFGLFKGIVPRIGLGVWQTLFMVTGAKMIKERLS